MQKSKIATFWTIEKQNMPLFGLSASQKLPLFGTFKQKLWITLLKTQKMAENDCAPKKSAKKIKAGKP